MSQLPNAARSLILSSSSRLLQGSKGPSSISTGLPPISFRPCPNRCFTATASRLEAGEDQGYDEEEIKERRQWVVKFEQVQLRKEDFDVSFSRSSGPGGQNVNKLNTKANVRLDLHQSGKHVPDGTQDSSPKVWLTRDLISRIAKSSPYYVASSHSLMLTSMRHRTQEANLQDALEKMQQHILEIASEGLVGETSTEQRQRVRRLQAAEQRRKKATKVKRSDVKSGRKCKG